MANRYAKDAATGRTPRGELPEGYRGELPKGYARGASLAHMMRVATEVRSKATTDWIMAHVRPGRRYRPPPGESVRRTQLRRVKKTLAERYYQLLSGHAETGTHRDRFGRTDTLACWWCASGEPTSLRGARHGGRRRGGYGRRSGRLWGGRCHGPRRCGVWGRLRPWMPFWNFYAPRGWGAWEQGECPRRTRGRTVMERRGAQARPRMYLYFVFPLWSSLLLFPFCWWCGGPIMTS